MCRMFSHVSTALQHESIESIINPWDEGFFSMCLPNSTPWELHKE